jgi:enoyl-CoA hydratase
MVTHEIIDDIAILRMDDGKANALNHASLDSIQQAIDAVTDAKAIVLTGRTGFFSGGLDLKLLPTLPVDQLGQTLEKFFALTLNLLQSPVPVVAAVGGHAMAGGVILALASDYVIGARGPFKMALNEVAIGIQLPALVIELARAKVNSSSLFRVLAHGETFGMDDALRVGFLDELVEPAELESAALKRAQALAKIPSGAYQIVKAELRKHFTDFTVDDMLSPIQMFFDQLKARP